MLRDEARELRSELREMKELLLEVVQTSSSTHFLSHTGVWCGSCHKNWPCAMERARRKMGFMSKLDPQ